MITWKELTDLEPRLKDLHNEIRETVKGCTLTHEEANHLWYGPPGEDGFKHQMNKLVGYLVDRGDDRLRDSDAYNVAYTKLYFETLLPAVHDIDEDYDPRFKPNKKNPLEINTWGDERKHSGESVGDILKRYIRKQPVKLCEFEVLADIAPEDAGLYLDGEAWNTDHDGDCLRYKRTIELMPESDIRVFILPGIPPRMALRALKKISRQIEQNPDLIMETEPQEVSEESYF